MFLQAIVNGTLFGGVYVCIGMGFSLVWGVMNIINLAHGSFIMLGAYITYTLFTYLKIDPFLTLPVSMIALYFMARGLIGEPTAPVMGKHGAQKKNS